MMNDEPDLFERRLSHQPLRQVPPELRAEILAAANASTRPAVNVAALPLPVQEAA